MSSVIMNLLNKVIPLNLALKGLEKVNPKFKSFITGASAAGYSGNQIIDFLRNQFSGGQMREVSATSRPDEIAAANRRSKEESPGKIAQAGGSLALGAGGGLLASALTPSTPAPEEPSVPAQPAASVPKPGTLSSSIAADVAAQNAPEAQTAPSPVASKPSVSPSPQAPQMASKLISNFPQLGKFMDSEMAKGLSPIQAAQSARKQRMLMPIISKIESQIDESFEDLIGRLYADVSPNSQAPMNANQSKKDAELFNSFQNILKM